MSAQPITDTTTWTPRPGKALALRSCHRSGYGDTTGKLIGHGDFVWPETPGAAVEAPDWDPTPRCGGGLHGLLWGTGSLAYLGEEEFNTFLVVEVDEGDVVQIDGADGPDKVKFPRATVVHVGTFASCAELISQYAPDWTSRKEDLRQLSQYSHKLYAVELDDQRDDYAEAEDIEIREEVPLGPFARVISSEVVDDLFTREITDPDDDPLHTIVLDIDFPVRVVESSTGGHHHLYIDCPLSWSIYEKLLDALAEAGVVQQGYVDASKSRRGTHLRLPWIRKSVSAPAPDQRHGRCGVSAVRAAGRCLTVGELREALAGLRDTDRVLVDGYDVEEVRPVADNNLPAGVELRSGYDVCARHLELNAGDCECYMRGDDDASALLQRYVDKEINATELHHEAKTILGGG